MNAYLGHFLFLSLKLYTNFVHGLFRYHIPELDKSTGATHGVSDKLLKMHGRWVTDRSKDRYIKDNLESQMAVSLNIGI